MATDGVEALNTMDADLRSRFRAKAAAFANNGSPSVIIGASSLPIMAPLMLAPASSSPASPAPSAFSSEVDSSPSSPSGPRSPSPSLSVPQAGPTLPIAHPASVVLGLDQVGQAAMGLGVPSVAPVGMAVCSPPRVASSSLANIPPPMDAYSAGVMRPGASVCSSPGAISLLAGKYLLLEQIEGSNLHRCVNVHTRQEYVCKAIKNDPTGHCLLAAHDRVDGHPHINPVREVIVGERVNYVLFPPSQTDLHSYVRTRRRLREPQARTLFRQIVAAVHEAHSKGIVLRDLKLRKFVFTNESRTEIKLESLEDAVVLEDESDDLLSDKHGCPAYVSPEILRCNNRYSGRAADMWGLGVMLYTMLVGRYPFHGQEHTGLFAKIRRGQFSLPDSLSSRAKCLIRCLLRKEPADRLTTEDVLIHPWLTQLSSRERARRLGSSGHDAQREDQLVPDLPALMAPCHTMHSSHAASSHLNDHEMVE